PAAQVAPPLPVVLGHAVLDRHDRIARDQVLEVRRELLGAEPPALGLEHVGAVREELRARYVEPEEDVASERIARRLDGSGNRLERLLVRAEVRREPALVADRRAE